MNKQNFIYCLIVLLWHLITPDSAFSSSIHQNRFDSIANYIDQYYFTYENECLDLVGELYEIARNSPDSIRLQAECLYREATIRSAYITTDSLTSSKIKEFQNKIDINKHPYEYALSLYSMGVSLKASGDYAEAFSSSLKALDLFRQQKNDLFVAKSIGLLGNICNSIEALTMAEVYYLEALELMPDDKLDYYKIKINLSRVYFYQQLYPKGIETVESCIPKAIELDDKGLLSLAYLNLALCYYIQRDFDKMNEYNTKAESILSGIDNERLNANLYQNRALYYMNFEDYEKTMQDCNKAEAIAGRHQISDLLVSIYSMKSTVFQLQHKYDSAYHYLNGLTELQFKERSNSNNAYQSYIDVLLDAHRNDLIISEQEIMLRKRWFWLAISISLTVVIVTILSLILVRQQKRIKEKENKELEKNLKQEKIILQLQERELKAQEREITSSSLHLSTKNDILQQILDLLNVVQSDQKELKEIKKMIKNNLKGDQDWGTFLMHFEKVHPNFFDKLKEKNNKLTENNLRICAYFKLGIPNKQIAHLLNITPESLILHRHRLKTKLNLDPEENLDDFIRTL